MDPVVRQPRGVVQQVEAATPGLSEGVPARVDRFGQPVTREGGPVRRMADPFNTSAEKQDPIANYAISFGMLGTRLVISYYRSDYAPEFAQWYVEYIRSKWPLMSEAPLVE